MTHCRWKHRSVTLLLVLLILVGLLCPAYAIKSTYETGWPMLGKYSENNVSGSYYNLYNRYHLRRISRRWRYFEREI